APSTSSWPDPLQVREFADCQGAQRRQSGTVPLPEHGQWAPAAHGLDPPARWPADKAQADATRVDQVPAAIVTTRYDVFERDRRAVEEGTCSKHLGICLQCRFNRVLAPERVDLTRIASSTCNQPAQWFCAWIEAHITIELSPGHEALVEWLSSDGKVQNEACTMCCRASKPGALNPQTVLGGKAPSDHEPHVCDQLSLRKDVVFRFRETKRGSHLSLESAFQGV